MIERHKIKQCSIKKGADFSDKDEDIRRMRILFEIHCLWKKYEKGEADSKLQRAFDSMNLLEEKKLWYATPDEILSNKQLDTMHAEIYGKIAQKQKFAYKNWTEVKKTKVVASTLPETGIKRISNRANFKILKKIIVAAAVITVFLGITFLLLPERKQLGEILVSNDHCISETLGDGTTVILNKGSFLSLSSDFNKENRKLTMSGEIFFNVSKNSKKPFIIRHGELVTIVKGTSFTISNYPGLEKNTLTVHTGTVSVNCGEKELAQLIPNQRLIYNEKEHIVTTMTINAAQLAGWTEGKLTFIDADERELKLRMQQYFCVNLIIKDYAFGKEGSMQFNAQFKKGAQVEDVLEHLKLVYSVSYQKRGNTVVIYKE